MGNKLYALSNLYLSCAIHTNPVVKEKVEVDVDLTFHSERVWKQSLIKIGLIQKYNFCIMNKQHS